MKQHPAVGSSAFTGRISPIEAVSKWRTPPCHSARNTSGVSLHLTAYSTSPGKPAITRRARAVMRLGRRQRTGSVGETAESSASALLKDRTIPTSQQPPKGGAKMIRQPPPRDPQCLGVDEWRRGLWGKAPPL